MQLERPGYTITPVSPRTVLRGEDRLRFVGRVDDVVDLHGIGGLRSSEDGQLAQLGGDTGSIYEVVLGQSSPVVGQTIRDAEFRGRYQAAVVAVHRAGRRIDAKLGDVQLRVGDTLLLIGDDDFESQWGEQPDFLLVSGVGELTRRGVQRRALLVRPSSPRWWCWRPQTSDAAQRRRCWGVWSSRAVLNPVQRGTPSTCLVV